MPSANILIVDDTPFNNEVLKIGLSAQGYHIDTAISAQAAEEMLAKQLPDLILLDVLMPVTNGYEFCASLKQNPATHDIPVIFMSALHETVDKLRGFAVGGVDYLTKPLEFDEVVVRVRTHLTLYQQRREIERLYAQASELATLHERQRIARELHDSLNQSLFSINSIAEALPRIMAKNPVKAVGYAEQLVTLTRGAQAEMRAMLVELRPDALMGASLAALLRQLCGIFAANSIVEVTLELDEGVKLPPEIQIVFYRIAQEALNNIARHAQCQHVSVTLSNGTHTQMVITDDGCGFDMNAVPHDHFGLRIMHERADDIGASLIISTMTGSGTTVRLTL
jgi:signal transduction histidine kinase